MPYKELLRHPFWQRKRLEIFQRDKFTCQNCTDKLSNLQVHHIKYLRDRMPWDYPDHLLTTLCELCHQKEEFYKFLKKHFRIYLLFQLKLSIQDTEEVLNVIRRRVKEDFYPDRVTKYMYDIKLMTVHG